MSCGHNTTSPCLMAVSGGISPSGDGTEAMAPCLPEGEQTAFIHQYLSSNMPRIFSPYAPRSPKYVFREFCPRTSFFRHFLSNRSLILAPKKDIEKNLNASPVPGSKLGSDHSVEVSDLSTKLRNPLAGRNRETLEADAVSFCEKHGLMEYGS
jgi:hypothetical protein